MQNCKIVICDDAAMIRNRLAKHISTHFPNAQITGVYPDGDDILNHLKQEPIDILITDICMENTDGLAVAKYIYERKLQTKVIIITGYQDFEYAQKALKYHTSALITKPIDVDEIINAVSEAQKELAASFTAATEQSDTILNKHRQAQQLLSLFLQGKITPEDLGNNKIFTDTDNKKAFLLNFYIPDSPENFKVENLDGSVLTQDEDLCAYSLCSNPFAASYLAISSNDTEKSAQRINEIINDAVKSVKLFNNATCKAYTFEISDIKAVLSSVIFKDFQAYFSTVSNTEKINFMRSVENITENLSGDELKCVLSQLLTLSAKRLRGEDLSGFYTRTKHIGKTEEGKSIFADLHKALTSTDSEGDFFAEHIADYIYNNISDISLSLEMVSKHFGYSPEHFSRKFKKSMGITFQSYLTDYRIEYAKKLISNSKLSVMAISAQIGFKDPTYFSKVFKKKTGFLPKDWRNK